MIIRFFRFSIWYIIILLIIVNIIFQISIEKNGSFITTHNELSHLLDRHKQSLRTEYRPTAEFWSSFLEMVEILFAFNWYITTGKSQAHLAASKKNATMVLCMWPPELCSLHVALSWWNITTPGNPSRNILRIHVRKYYV